MPVTIHPSTFNAEVEPVVEARGVDWKIQSGGTLQVVDQSFSVVSEFASGQWAWVEKS